MTQNGNNISPQAALLQLTEGNQRYINGQSQFPRLGSQRRDEVTIEGQHPVATVISCSDSRCPVELVFDQGIGDIFSIRVAGNVCANDEIGSIEYGVGHAGSPLCVVLGHTHCGAVTAVAAGADVHGCIPKLVEPINRPVALARLELPGAGQDDLVAHAIKLNVWQAIEDLVTTSIAIRQLAVARKVVIVGAIYDIKSGRVEWLGEHPSSGRLLGA